MNHKNDQATNDSQNQPAHVDINVLKDMFGDDDLMVREILSEFKEPSHEIVTSLEIAIKEGNLKEINQLAHKLKSSSRAVGAMELGEICEQLESAAGNNENDKIPALASAYQEEVEAVFAFVDSY